MTFFRLLAVCGMLAPLLSADDRSRILDQYSQLPLAFEPNLGQTDSQVQYIARSAGYTLFLTRTGAVMQLSAAKDGNSQSLRLRFENSLSPASTTPLERQAGVSAYFLGNDPAKWISEVPHYSRVRYNSIYPGIDVAWYGNGRQVEYDFIVAPGADPRRILLSYDGAHSVHIDRSGDLVLTTSMGDLRQRKPRVYQEIGGRQFEVSATYKLSAGKLAFDLGPYNHRHALVIDPVLIYSTYLGGNTRVQDLAMDATGAVYVTGQTASLTFPTANPFQLGFGGSISGDAFVTKLNAWSATGPVTLAYSTYLGGAGYDSGEGIAVDSAGAAYIAGSTNDTTTFPSLNALASIVPASGRVVGFVTKLAPYSGTGKVTLAYSTPLGGSSSLCHNISVDSSGAAYVVGFTYTSDFPNVNGLLPFQAGDGFVARLNPYSGTGKVTLAYSTSLGSSAIYDVAVDSAGAAYVTGSGGPNLITLNGIQPSLTGAFVAKLNPFANGPVSLAYSTYVGNINPTVLTIDSAGGAYVAGYTNSRDLPTVHAYQSQIGGNNTVSGLSSPYDAFLLKVNPFTNTGNVTLGFSTYLGGTAPDFAYGIALDSAGAVYVTGTTKSPNYPILDTAPATFTGTLGNAFITKFNQPSGSGPLTLAYSTLLGGAQAAAGGNYFPDTGTGIAVDSTGAIQVAGYTSSPSFPLLNAFQTTFIDVITDALLDSDGFVARLPQPGTIVKTPVNVTVSSPTVTTLAAGQHIVYGQPVSLTATFSAPATGTVYFVGSNLGALLCSAQVAAGVATCMAPGSSELLPGTDTVTVGYTGDTTYTLGTVSPLTFPVDKAPTTTALSISPPNPSGPVTLTAAVAITPPAHVFQNPSGTVTFTSNGVAINGCTARPFTTNFCFNNCPAVFTATCSTVPSSSTNLSASYTGDSFTSPSVAPPLQVEFKPAPVAVSPGSGNGSMRTFVFTDPRGYQDLGVVNILINDVLDGRRACYLAYSQPLQLLYLVNDTGDAPLPGVPLNGLGGVNNGQCTVFGTSSANGNTLALALNITFSSAFAGNKVVYMAAGNVAGDNSGWLPMGVWQALGTPPGVSVVSMAPASGSGFVNQTFTFNFSDTNGWQDLGVMDVLINDALNGNHACYVAYSRPTNTLYLVNDAGNALFPGVPLNGQAVFTYNTQCAVTAATIAASGNILTLTLRLTFSPAFVGNRIFYLAARDVNESNNTGWQALGAWSVQQP